MRLGLILLCLLTLSAPAAAREETGDTQELTVVYRPLAPTGCSLRTARRADFATVAADPGAKANRCIRLKGVLVGRLFYADTDAYFRAGGGMGMSSDGDDGQLGIYGSKEVMDNLPGQPVWAEIAARAGTCETLGQGAFMVMGYCHYTGGGYLAVAEMDLGEPFKPIRLASDADRARVGSLRLLPAEDPRSKIAEARVREWLAVIRSRDLPRLAKIEWRLTPEQATIYPYAGRAWGWLRRAPPDTPVRVFRDIKRSADDNSGTDFLYACICRGADCEGLWPITSYDASLAPGRPYACLQVARLKSYPKWDTEAQWDFRRLREPKRPGA